MSSLMHPMRERRSGIASLLLLLHLAACTTWHVGTPTPAEFVEREHPQKVRVTRRDGISLELKSPVVRGDSLVGTAVTIHEAPTTGLAPASRDSAVSLLSIALSDVQSVKVERASPGRSFLAVIAGVIVVIGLVAIIDYSNSQYFN
jgi:hypothetical protein